MPDEITDSTASAATIVETAAIAAPVVEVAKTFTQEQVNAFVQQRLAADRATRSKPEPAPAAAQPTKPAPAADSDVRAELEEMKQRNAFDKRIAKYDVPDETSERLFKLYKVEKPEDPTAWTAETAKQFGLRSLTQPVTPTAIATATTATVAPTAANITGAAPNPGARVDGTTNAGIQDLFQLTPAKMDELGPVGMRKIFEEATTLGRQLSGAPTRPKLPTQR